MKKKIAISLLLIALVVGVAYGAAAALAVSGGAIQGGSDTDLRCDTDGVQVAGWGLETNDGKVYFVRIGGIATTCIGNDLFVNITKAGTKIAGGSVTIVGAVEKVSFTPQLAADITDLHVWIEGPNGL